jgi:predicted deacylase
MKLVERGAGRPRVAVVGGVHGDEPAGERIVERLLGDIEHADVSGTIQLVLANEPALARGERVTETDLNRSFPGMEESDTYEEALAARLYAVLEGADATLVIHTSHSVPPPFAIYSELTESVRRTVTALPVEHAMAAGDLRSTTLDSVLSHAVSIEAGEQGSESAVEFGHEATLAYLRAHGVLEGSVEYTETTVVEGLEEVPKGGGTPRVHYENFEEIPEGEIFAEDDVEIHRTDRPGLVPVLASEHGYEDIFGIYGTVTQTLEPPES